MFEMEFAKAVSERLGLTGADRDVGKLAGALVEFLVATKAPFEQVFFDWFGGHASQARAGCSPAAEFYKGEAFEPLSAALGALEPRDAARLDHAYFQQERPCTMLIDEVEAIWAPIAEADDWSAFRGKLEAIALMREAYGR